MNIQVVKEKVNSFGENMLKGVMPECISEDWEEGFSVRCADAVSRIEYIDILTQDNDAHVDIDGHKYKLTYDLKYTRDFDSFYVAAYVGIKCTFAFCDIDIFVSDSKEALYNEENLVACVSNKDNCLFDGEDIVRVLVKGKAKGRYVGFYQKSSNSNDIISRMVGVAAFCEDYTNLSKPINDKRLGNLLFNTSPVLSGSSVGDPAFVTDGAINYNFIKLTGGLKFSVAKPVTLEKLVIIGKDIKNATAQINGKDYPLTFIQSDFEGLSEYIFENSGLPECTEFTLNFDGTVRIDQVMLYAFTINLSTDFDNPCNEDFYGLGANVIPTHLFEGGRLHGWNEAYFALEQRRVSVAKPAVARIWFQLDWFILDGENYKNGVYNFNTPKMEAVFKEFDSLKAAGTDIDLNFGWKMGIPSQKWYAFENIPNKRGSAPKDLDLFAKALVGCLKEFILKRGYTNIKYLSFFNESNGVVMGGTDFLCPPEINPKEYFGKLLQKCNKALEEANLRHLVKIWAMDAVGGAGNLSRDSAGEWLRYMHDNHGNIIDCYTAHVYLSSYAQAEYDCEFLKETADGKPFAITEFSNMYDVVDFKNFSFTKNNISTVLSYLNGGCSACLFWILSGAYVEEGFFHDNSQYAFWNSPVLNSQSHVDNVNLTFYEFSLITNYIPAHSKIFAVKTEDENVHAVAAITPSGDYTICVETNNNAYEKKLNFNFNKNINKTFYKHEFSHNVKIDGNCIIPPAIKQVKADNALKDTLLKEYNFAVYTTMKPRMQVKLDKLYAKINPGESVKFNAEVIDGSSKIKWSICDVFSTTGYKGTIDQNGVYTADSRKSGNMNFYGMTASFAIKAEAENGEYAIAIVEIS